MLFKIIYRLASLKSLYSKRWITARNSVLQTGTYPAKVTILVRLTTQTELTVCFRFLSNEEGNDRNRGRELLLGIYAIDRFRQLSHFYRI